MAKPPASIEKIASAYCEGESNVAMYQQALVLAQCDVMILRLRANGVALLKCITERQPLAGGNALEDSPYGGMSAALGNTTVDQPLDLDPEAVRFGAMRRGDLASLDSLKPIFLHLEVLSRLEDEICRRRRRALRGFLAIRKARLRQHSGTNRS